MTRIMPRTPRWLKAGTGGGILSRTPAAGRDSAALRGGLIGAGRAVGVDKDNGILQGYVIAQEGPFKSDGRGAFDRQSLRSIVALGNASPGGLKSRFSHPDASSDGLGKFLGRARDLSLSTALNAAGEIVAAVRGDLHFASSASRTPSGDLAGYILDLASEDPAALSSSLALMVDKEDQLDANGRTKLDAEGNELPPLWRPTALHASDIVDTGDAVDGILSAGLDVEDLPLSALWKADALLDQVFQGQPADVVEARLRAWTERYLGRLRVSPGGRADVARRREKLRRWERAAGDPDESRRMRLRLREQEARC